MGKKKVAVAEWWEVWVEVPGSAPVRKRMYGQAFDVYVPREGFPTRSEAKLEAKRSGRFARVVHVVRYATRG